MAILMQKYRICHFTSQIILHIPPKQRVGISFYFHHECKSLMRITEKECHRQANEITFQNLYSGKLSHLPQLSLCRYGSPDFDHRDHHAGLPH